MLLTNLCLSVTSLGLVGERESGTYEQMLVAADAPLEIVLGKLVPYVGVCYVLLLFAIVVPGLVLRDLAARQLARALVATLPFVLASLAIGVLVSTLARPRRRRSSSRSSSSCRRSCSPA